jgi:nucleotide-binding universal stress UspA family protein
VTIVVGLPRDERAAAAVHLGGMLARSFDDDLVVCTVVPPPWPPGLGRVDAEYQEFLDHDAAEALDDARDLMSDDVRAEYVVVAARSTSAGLLEVAERHGASLLALGSSTAGALGRVAFGSVADRLLHSSPLPVALAPRGFRCRPVHRLTRLTAAFGASEGSDELVVAAAGVASRVGASLRVASFAVRARTPLTAGIGSRAEDSVMQVWSSDVAAAQHKVLDEVARLPHPPAAEAVIGHGRDWTAALEDIGWHDGDILAVGSSTTAPVARVFIGSRSSKIVRHSPVPVVVIPRGAALALAERAEQGQDEQGQD